NINEVDKLTSSFQNLTADLLERGSNSIKIKSNWSLFNDEIFEQICYDLILRDGRFVPEETRKMGLSKSRDGGRDIIAFEKSHSGQKKKRLWIIQCKFSKLNKSLGRDDIRLSELIDEYLPYGIIIATNMIIDAGAYDKFDRIARNRKININYFNGLWIERLLNRNPDLLRCYKLTDV
ncbi:MAG: restriction endonuclease, partial [Treponema sp.]|nr:restriction endonuclease [Treponema sp.]